MGSYMMFCCSSIQLNTQIDPSSREFLTTCPIVLGSRIKVSHTHSLYTLICLKQCNSHMVNPPHANNPALSLTKFYILSGCSGPRGLPNWAALSWLLHMVTMPLCPALFSGMASLLPSLSQLIMADPLLLSLPLCPKPGKS